MNRTWEQFSHDLKKIRVLDSATKRQDFKGNWVTNVITAQFVRK